MKKYRRRLANLSYSLIVVVLLEVLVLGVFFSERNLRREVYSSMKQVLAPFNPGFMHIPPAQEGANNNRESITVVFYSPGTGTIDILSNQSAIEEELLLKAAGQVAKQKSEYGVLSYAKLLFYREDTREQIKIAFLPVSYLRKSEWRVFRIYLGLFSLALLIFYNVSNYLAGIAIRPMEEAMAREAQFVMDLSHDLKTPLTVILANTDILRRDPEQTVSQQMNWVDSTQEAANTMLTMVNEMLTISQVENAQKTLEKTEIDLSSLTEKICLQMDSVVYEKGLSLSENIPVGITVSAREDYLTRILSSLVENAVKYEPPGGCVSVTLREEHEYAVVTVQNPGALIPKEDLPHIFERFYRADKSRTGHNGFGLGLAIAREMTEALGGTLSAQSTPEVGTVFCLRLKNS